MKLDVKDLGHMDYQSALDMQFELLEKRQNNLIPDTLILVEHPPTITLGRRAVEADILADENFLKETGVEICRINRGGEVTYHGPGQIVGYLIFDLKNFNRDIRAFVSNIEEAIIQVLEEEFNIVGERNPLNNGVWVGPKKITAIGIGIKQWVTMHGFAFNINTNLEHFKWIVPCGMKNTEMTSLEQITGKQHDLETIKPKIIAKIRQIFE
ncbi:MAG: lipoyl(octanoyl) transferase LipB [Kiritimatiellae bacterium]|jgi:lipoyl(octanoyl) transferase|nr:lipoyl(octanoyl) transferase LipB [Kiritimatiellia bacterium]